MRVSTRDIYTKMMCSEDEVVIPVHQTMVETFEKGPVPILEGTWIIEDPLKGNEICYRTYADINPESWPFCPSPGPHSNTHPHVVQFRSSATMPRAWSRFTVDFVEVLGEVQAIWAIKDTLLGMGISEGYTADDGVHFRNDNYYHLIKKYKDCTPFDIDFIRVKVTRNEDLCVSSDRVKSILRYYSANVLRPLAEPIELATGLTI